MEEMKKEIYNLNHQIHRLKINFVAVQVAFIVIAICFQIQYSRMISYYQSTVESNQEILLNQKWQSYEIQHSLSMIEELLPD